MYERAGSFTDILPPAAPASSFCATTVLGDSKVLKALRSGPVTGSHARTLDGVNFVPQDKLSACVRITAPAGIKIYYGPFRVPLTQPLNLDSRTGC